MERKSLKYILTVIDLYTKYAWAVPLPNKKGQTVAQLSKRLWMNQVGNQTKFRWIIICLRLQACQHERKSEIVKLSEFGSDIFEIYLNFLKLIWVNLKLTKKHLK